MSTNRESTFLVFESALLLLFSVCRYCLSPITNVRKMVLGSLLKIEQTCGECNNKWIWNSQPYYGAIPAGNVLQSSAILFSGCLPAKALRMFSILRCASITRKTYFRHQSELLTLCTQHVWNLHQSELIREFKDKNKKLILSGDGRADSPGHSAKYGSYTVVDLTVNKVVDFQLVQVRHSSVCIHIYVIDILIIYTVK